MARYINPIVVVPWVDTNGMKQRTMLSFKGDVDHRKLRKILMDFCERNFQKVTKKFADALIEANVKTFSKTEPRSPTMTVTDKMVEEWIERIQDKDEPTENKSDPASEGDVP